MKLHALTEIVGRKRYRTDTATLLAHNAYYDGKNYERRGCNLFLLRTAKGNYFAQFQAAKGVMDVPSTVEDALRYMNPTDLSVFLSNMVRGSQVDHPDAPPVKRDWIQPLSEQEAIDLYEKLEIKELDFEQAFPDVQIEEA